MDIIFIICLSTSIVLITTGILFLCRKPKYKTNKIKEKKQRVREKTKNNSGDRFLSSVDLSNTISSAFCTQEDIATENTCTKGLRIIKEDESGFSIKASIDKIDDSLCKTEKDANEEKAISEAELFIAQLQKAYNFAPAILASSSISNLSEEQKKEQTLLLLQSAEILNTLSEGIKKIAILKSEEKRDKLYSEMKASISQLDIGYFTNYSKDIFALNYPLFFSNVKNISDDLNDLELRLCALIALDKNSKEMASITRKSVRTIETAVYRIRKKLDIPANEKTPDFLKNFLS